MKAKYLISNLINSDYELLGAGVYSAVFSSKKDSNFVYKIGCSLKDPFLDYISISKDNIHAPKVYTIAKSEKSNMYIAKMEKLTPVSDVVEGPIVSKFLNQIEQFFKEEVQFENINYSLNIEITPKLISLKKAIKKILGENKIDLHSNNFMLRDKTLIVNDPIAEKELDYLGLGVEEWIEEYSCSE